MGCKHSMANQEEENSARRQQENAPKANTAHLEAGIADLKVHDVDFKALMADIQTQHALLADLQAQHAALLADLQAQHAAVLADLRARSALYEVD